MAAVSATALVACSSSTSAKHSTTTSTSASPPRSSSAPRSASTPAPSGTPGGGVITVTDKPSLRTAVSLHVGNRLRVALGSTYWRFTDVSANPAVESVGSTTITADPNCIPGGGCGTAVHQYSAIGTGQVTITATRTSCGEALVCRPDQRAFTLIVTVSA
jgi:hypothetical protein